jgi:DNA invertase Pin-like site-specific DNA recombinase
MLIVTIPPSRPTKPFVHIDSYRTPLTSKMFTDPQFGESAVTRFTSNIIAAASEFQQDLIREHMAQSRAALNANGIRVAAAQRKCYPRSNIFSS